MRVANCFYTSLLYTIRYYETYGALLKVKVGNIKFRVSYSFLPFYRLVNDR